MGQAISLPAIIPMLVLCCLPEKKSLSAMDDFVPKTNLAVSSTEFCQSIFDEDQILGRKAWQAINLSHCGVM